MFLRCAGLGCWVAPGWVLAVRGKLSSVSKYSRDPHRTHSLSLCTGGYPPTCRITLPFTLRGPGPLYFYCQRSDVRCPPVVTPAAPMGLLWPGCDVTGWPGGSADWGQSLVCHRWPQAGPSPLLRIMQPKQIHDNTEYIYQGDTQWPLREVNNSVKHQRLGMQ